MTETAAKTGVGPTAMVAVEQYFPAGQRMISDDLACLILPFGVRMFVRLMRFVAVRDWMVRTTEKSIPGIWGSLMCRKRYIDDRLIEAIGQIDAVVNLGAGFDTRLYRLPELAETPAWEVDHIGNIESKRTRLQKLFGEVPAHVKLVSIDFDREQLHPVLASCGYSLDQQTFFIWEGVTQYVTEAGIKATLDFLAGAASGSRLVFSYVLSNFINGTNLYGQGKLYQQYVIENKAWLSGMNPEDVEDFLKPYGWRVVEDAGYDALLEKYIKPVGRKLPSMPIERVVYAEKL